MLAPALSQRTSIFSCVYLFLAGCLIRIDVHLLGRLAIGELLLIAYTPFAISSLATLSRVPYFRMLRDFILLWAFGTVLSDLINDSELQYFLRGFAKPALCGVLLLVCVHLIPRDPRSLTWFFFGLAVSGIINFLVPTDYRAAEIAKNVDPTDGYKYSYYAYVYTPAAYAVASVGGFFAYKLHPLAGGALQIFIGALAIPLLSRTAGCVLLLSGAIIVITHVAPQLRQLFFDGKRVNSGVLLKFSMAAITTFCATYYLYAYLASNGLIGETQQKKYIQQANATKFGDTPIGIIASGRHYTVGSILRIIDHPIFGAGSWPRTGDTLIRSAEISGRDFDFSRHDPEVRDIGHSIIFGLWAQNGLLVLPFLLTSFAAIVRSYLLLCFSHSPLKALIPIYLVTLMFGFFFNNFNSLARVLLVIMPIFIYQTTSEARSLPESAPYAR